MKPQEIVMYERLYVINLLIINRLLLRKEVNCLEIWSRIPETFLGKLWYFN